MDLDPALLPDDVAAHRAIIVAQHAEISGQHDLIARLRTGRLWAYLCDERSHASSLPPASSTATRPTGAPSTGRERATTIASSSPPPA